MKKRSSESRGWKWNVGRMLLSITLALGAGSAWSNSSEAPKAMDELALDALWWGDFEEFERLYRVANVVQERSKSGETSVDLFRTGIGRVMRGGEAGGDAYIAQVEALARQWVSERPDSVLAHLLLVRTLYERAWTYRGGGFAGTVTAQAMIDFRKYIALAVKQMESHSKLVMSDPTAHVYLLMIGRSASWKKEVLFAIATDGVGKSPQDVDIYIELLTGMLPKWGGDEDAMEAVAQLAMKNGGARAMELYALVYEAAAWEFEAGLFDQTKANWPRIKQGYRDLLAGYPDAVNVNRFAKMACLAQDRQTASELMSKIGDAPVLARWGTGSDGRRNFDACKRWLK